MTPTWSLWPCPPCCPQRSRWTPHGSRRWNRSTRRRKRLPFQRTTKTCRTLTKPLIIPRGFFEPVGREKSTTQALSHIQRCIFRKHIFASLPLCIDGTINFKARNNTNFFKKYYTQTIYTLVIMSLLRYCY